LISRECKKCDKSFSLIGMNKHFQLCFTFFLFAFIAVFSVRISAQPNDVANSRSSLIASQDSEFGGGRDQKVDVQSRGKEAQIDRLLSWLGIAGNIQQIDRVVDQNSKHLGGDFAKESAREFRHRMQAHDSSQSILNSVRADIIAVLDADIDTIDQLLAEPLPVRVRNFDVAMSMEGAQEKFRLYQEALQEKPPAVDRLALIERLGSALKTTAFVALIQTEINVTVQILTAKIGKTPELFLPDSLVNSQRDQRESYLKDVSSDLNLFSYRFLKDSELRAYIEVMEKPNIQLLLNTAYAAIKRVLIQSREKVLVID